MCGPLSQVLRAARSAVLVAPTPLAGSKPDGLEVALAAVARWPEARAVVRLVADHAGAEVVRATFDEATLARVAGSDGYTVVRALRRWANRVLTGGRLRSPSAYLNARLLPRHVGRVLGTRPARG